MPRLNLEPCQNCRKQHLKCDGSKPTCSRCKERGQPCISSQAIQFRSSKSNFANDQPWPSILTSRLRFIDETPDLAFYYDHELESTYSGLPPEQDDTQSWGQALLKQMGDRTDDNDQVADQAAAPSIPRPTGRETQIATPDSASYRKPSSTESPDSHTSALASQPIANQSVDLPQSFWSDKGAQDACLMRYFVEELAPWFDTCDAAKHFALVAPQRAKSCPPLLYAIFSASARHLSRRQIINGNESFFAGKKLPSLGEERALEYQSLCISHLMALSGNMTEVQDENLLAAAVILRFYEEYDAPLVGIDDETYLRGTQVFIDAQSTAAIRSDGLRRAAFWVAFRQEWHRAFIKQSVFRFDSRCCASSVYRSLGPVDDNTWTNRMVLHCTDVVTYCYGESRSVSRYDELWEYNVRWQSLVPSTFNPLHSREPDLDSAEVFPEIWYLDDCIITAIQHYLLARICLIAFDPRTPRMGLGRKNAVAQSEDEIRRNLFELCGIARSNKTAPALVMACMGVTMCGDRVARRVEQEALFGILVRLEEVHALSTRKVQTQLRECWGWNDTSGMSGPST